MQGIFCCVCTVRADSRRSEHRFDATDFDFLGCIRESLSLGTKFIFESTYYKVAVPEILTADKESFSV